MPRAIRETVPTSVILTKDQKAFIKRVAEKESRTFSHQLRFVIESWVNKHRKENRSGKEAKEVEKEPEAGEKSQEVTT